MTTSSVAATAQVTDFMLSPELRQFRDYVVDYTKKHLGNAASYDAETKFPRDPVAAAARLGLLRTTVAKEYGGSAMGNLASCIMLEGDQRRLRVDRRHDHRVHNSLVNSLLQKWCSDAQKRRWFPKLVTVSGSAPTVSARPSRARMRPRCVARRRKSATTTS
jgi:alkylation response protein AidB-like acyl-CoA dehydrogenase